MSNCLKKILLCTPGYALASVLLITLLVVTSIMCLLMFIFFYDDEKLKNRESYFIRIKPKTTRNKFSPNFNNPIFDPALVPKHPQSIFKPRMRLIPIAIINIIIKLEIIKEFSFTNIPNSNSIPATSSVHGRIIANILTKCSGSNL